jgi:hypothetical protein
VREREEKRRRGERRTPPRLLVGDLEERSGLGSRLRLGDNGRGVGLVDVDGVRTAAKLESVVVAGHGALVGSRGASELVSAPCETEAKTITEGRKAVRRVSER